MPWLEDIYAPAVLDQYVASGWYKKFKHPNLPLTLLVVDREAVDKSRSWGPHLDKFDMLMYHGEESDLRHNIISRAISRIYPLRGAVNDPVLKSRCTTLRTYKEWKEEDPSYVQVYEKVDGEQGLGWQYTTNGYRTHYGVVTRRGFEDPVSEWATKWVNDNGIKWARSAYPTFEILSEQTKKVVNYPYQGLVLISFTLDSSEWSRIDQRRWANEYRVPMPRCYAAKDFTNLAEETRDNFEGYVISSTRGRITHRAKVQTKSYIAARAAFELAKQPLLNSLDKELVVAV
jgi:hypothetical protein